MVDGRQAPPHPTPRHVPRDHQLFHGEPNVQQLADGSVLVAQLAHLGGGGKVGEGTGGSWGVGGRGVGVPGGEAGMKQGEFLMFNAATHPLRASGFLEAHFAKNFVGVPYAAVDGVAGQPLPRDKHPRVYDLNLAHVTVL